MEVAIFSAAVRSSSVLDDTRFAVEVLSRLPLADSVWRLLHYAMEDSWLDHLWARHRGRCYEKQLKFRTLAHLITDALIEHQGSGHQAFTRAREQGSAGLDHLVLRQVRELAPVPQRGPARGRHPAAQRGSA